MTQAVKRLIDYIIALTNLYGIVSKQLLLDIYNSQNEEQISLADIEQQLKKPEAELEQNFIYPYRQSFAHESLIEFDECEQLLVKQAGKPHYIPEQAELLNYVDEYYVEKTESYDKLLAYIRQHFYPDNETNATELMEDILLTLQDEYNIEAVLFEFTRRKLGFEQEDQLNDLLRLINDQYNNTRLWENCGHTPKELFEQFDKPHLSPLPNNRRPADIYDIRTGSKIGRNDPCPCGSGRKYKHCCLGKQDAGKETEE